VRATALGALDRLGALTDDDVARGGADPSPVVRRRAAEVAATTARPLLLALLEDEDPTVVEMAAWALGEHPPRVDGDVAALAAVARTHDDALCREAAVAALGALEDPAGLPTILAALDDRAPIRRRAVIALAPFEGPEVDAALRARLQDRDRQVRQAAEVLLAESR